MTVEHMMVMVNMDRDIIDFCETKVDGNLMGHYDDGVDQWACLNMEPAAFVI